MAKSIYTDDNYIVIEQTDGTLQAFSGRSVYVEGTNFFFIKEKDSGQEASISFDDVTTWLNLDADATGNTYFTESSLRSFLRTNTGNFSGSSSSGGDTEDVDTIYTASSTIDGEGRIVQTTNDGTLSFYSYNTEQSDFTNYTFLGMTPTSTALEYAEGSGDGSVSGTYELDLSSSGAIFSDTIDGTGLQYAADYSETFTDRSLVDKEYVDFSISNLGDSSFKETFETVSKNLDSRGAIFNYNGDILTSITYSIEGGLSITKTFNYTGFNLTSIVLSGDTPSGIDLTKSFVYVNDKITEINYS